MRRPHIGLHAALLRRYPLSPWLHLLPGKPAEPTRALTPLATPSTTEAA
ncbi:hypothetical protein R4172_12305 [Rhodococcus kroppenstedtii]|uniref:Uncharacterized protein n=1 Tax=Rhodococcoides kroppenstedtii TaxID=293050 RepID=A0ABS7NTE8_9NOCA|nr:MULTISPECIES: hypothetical protein [Rhodococcus]AMY20463.1 hypothetical protein A3Q40_03101 [Rhodococcus sp. PBTS 1]MBY6315316.1 hypothetical protein [Rhodococcus kroppenstedtii]MBY6321302.1 hypothetical protein [Rhodococcus kroppenstedtii]MBY6400002.1 hypothetical protein [Rhodococcus kroppenstedtii]MDV7198344.1 hypothetical protein [Rhodococcus kroppenstedtii]